ncbi:MAG: NAD(P)-dependent oxidoreductase [Candidatus Moranbacteria bacterium]|nr:NAD(P)-dependent oxidoreductase [Candidatus Moranbacteria bacterium]
MRIVFFETTEKDEAYLKEKLTDHEILFVKEPLSEENAKKAADCEIISVFIYSAVTETVLKKTPSVKAIMTRSTGFDHIDLAACQKMGVVVANVPHYGENTVAEHTFALILALSRNVHKSYARGLKEDFSINGLMGFDLKDKTLGVIGTGHIGLHVIRIAKGFGMHVIAFDTQKNSFLSEVLHYQYAPLEEVLARADIITIHVPYNEHTHHLINSESIKKIKKGALLINTARGGIVENAALIAALDQGILSGAGLDVLEGEELIKEENQCLHTDCDTGIKTNDQNKGLLARDNVVFTPHIGFYSEEAIRRIIDTTLENITRFAQGKKNNPIPE